MAEPLNRWRRGENRSTRRKPLATSFTKCHILQSEDSSPKQNSNPHNSIGGKARKADVLTVTPCIAPILFACIHRLIRHSCLSPHAATCVYKPWQQITMSLRWVTRWLCIILGLKRGPRLKSTKRKLTPVFALTIKKIAVKFPFINNRSSSAGSHEGCSGTLFSHTSPNRPTWTQITSSLTNTGENKQPNCSRKQNSIWEQNFHAGCSQIQQQSSTINKDWHIAICTSPLEYTHTEYAHCWWIQQQQQGNKH